MTSTLSGVPGGTFSYDANDRLSIDTFDANGNTTSSAGISTTYDLENRMLTHGTIDCQAPCSNVDHQTLHNRE